MPTVGGRGYPRRVPRPATIHACSECGHESPKWHGRCPGCGSWNTLVEQRAPARAGAAAGSRSAGAGATRALTPVPLARVTAPALARLDTGIGELDRTLGGGLVPGSLVLVGGSPGIGKSTLTTMALGNLAAAGRRTLYVSAEESAEQVRLRAERLGAGALAVPVVCDNELGAILATLEAHRPEVCVLDSVQTVYDPQFAGAPGSVGQVREVAGRMLEVAKPSGITVLLVGHVTKEGSLAGPRVLEHLVDCVLQFEGERERTYRTLRALKNRFGATSEVGVFEMEGEGLREVPDASARFVAEAKRAPGSVVVAAMEGSRPLLVEVQALVSPSELVPPRRVVNGLDRNRLALVLAVLARHGGLGLGAADVFVNVVGGVRVEEPGADLAIALAVASAARGVVAGEGGDPGGNGGGASPRGGPRLLACFGELGLTGEVRSVAHPERRVAEAARFGLGSVICPSAPGVGGGLEAATLREALRLALPGRARGSAPPPASPEGRPSPRDPPSGPEHHQPVPPSPPRSRERAPA